MNDRLHETALNPFSNLASAMEYFTRLQLYGTSKSNKDRKQRRNWSMIYVEFLLYILAIDQYDDK